MSSNIKTPDGSVKQVCHNSEKNSHWEKCFMLHFVTNGKKITARLEVMTARFTKWEMSAPYII